METIQGLKRTGRCTEITKAEIGKEVTIMGWIQTIRDMGGILFLDLRDRSGIMQVVVNRDKDKLLFEKVEKLRHEDVIAVIGMVEKREEDTVNEKIPTGYIEVRANEIRILSKSEVLPFMIEESQEINELVRLKYRYLDLRRPKMQNIFAIRHKLMKIARDYYDQNGFYEIETPMLTKSTPEGARDYLVPSRVHPGEFYALPQSPQLFKQMLMLAGFDRYMQIARCFRDEDLRADRQPEFTQIDLEMSFVNIEDMIEVNEGFMKRVWKEILGVELQTPFLRMSYKEAMERFGSDKPDIRFGMELKDLTDLVKECDFKVFTNAIEYGGTVRAINVKQGAVKFSRRDIDSLGEFARIYRAKGMAWIAIKGEEMNSPVTKFLKQEQMDEILKRMEAEDGDLILFAADKNEIVFDVLGNLRLEIARRLEMLDDLEYRFLWVTEFPLFEYDEIEKRYKAKHHPFTMPMEEDISYLKTNPEKVRAKAYDIVVNGMEIGGGSLRIYDQELQTEIFKHLGFSEEETWERFGFLLEAFRYGTPPHGGMAYGLDRMMMLLTKTENIKDVIAFPKLQNASCPLTSAPSSVESKQLKELHMHIGDAS